MASHLLVQTLTVGTSEQVSCMFDVKTIKYKKEIKKQNYSKWMVFLVKTLPLLR